MPTSRKGTYVTRLIASPHIGEYPYRDLAHAIVCSAADDYKKALLSRNKALAREVESFFASEWYTVLCKLPPGLILQGVRMDAKEHKPRRRHGQH